MSDHNKIIVCCLPKILSGNLSLQAYLYEETPNQY